MAFNLKDIISNIFSFGKDDKKQEQTVSSADVGKFTTLLQQITGGNTENVNKPRNPFLNKDGSLVSPFVDYQAALDNPGISKVAKKYISDATGLYETPTITATINGGSGGSTGNDGSYSSDVNFNSGADPSGLGKLDVKTELPKLTSGQIGQIISNHFSKSTVIKPSDAEGIFAAQQKSGMSALAILAIGALESGYGTSNIAKAKNNLWGWNATNVNPGGNATSFAPVSEGAYDFATRYLKTYYNKYGAKSIFDAGTGSNPAGKGYAYHDDGRINTQWATSVSSIMKTFYNTAKAYGR